jgi:hypothetical protein
MTKVNYHLAIKSLIFISLLMNLFEFNAQNDYSKQTNINKKTDLNEVPATFRYVNRNKTISKDQYSRLSEKKKTKYDSIVGQNDFGVFMENLEEYFDEYYITKEACVKKNLDAEKKKYGLSPVDSVLSSLKFSNVSQLGFTLKPLGKEVEKIIKGITHIYGDDMDENWAKACENNVPAYCTHRDDGEQRYGVLLNPAAIQILDETLLKNNSIWRIPTKLDMDILNYKLSEKGNSAFQLLAGSKSKNLYNFKWKRPGLDAYEMGLMPWGYKMGPQFYFTNNSPKGMASVIACAENSNYTKKQNFIYLEQDSPVLKYGEFTDGGNYGFYVILFRNIDFKLND